MVCLTDSPFLPALSLDAAAPSVSYFGLTLMPRTSPGSGRTHGSRRRFLSLGSATDSNAILAWCLRTSGLIPLSRVKDRTEDPFNLHAEFLEAVNKAGIQITEGLMRSLLCPIHRDLKDRPPLPSSCASYASPETTHPLVVRNKDLDHQLS